VDLARSKRPPKRYAIIDLQSLSELSGFADLRDFQRAHREWIERGLENALVIRDDRWSEAIAVGSLPFVEKVKHDLGFKAAHRDVIEADRGYALSEPTEAYGLKFGTENEALRSQNAFLWDETVDEAST
jgi:putative transposase